MEVKCPHCQKTTDFLVILLRSTIKCPSCGKSMPLSNPKDEDALKLKVKANPRGLTGFLKVTVVLSYVPILGWPISILGLLMVLVLFFTGNRVGKITGLISLFLMVPAIIFNLEMISGLTR